MTNKCHVTHRNMSQDFLGAASNDADFDFDRAASAFPDIEGIDGDISAPVIQNGRNSFDNFDIPQASQFTTSMKITEPDELDKFTTDFPELEPQVCYIHCHASCCN